MSETTNRILVALDGSKKSSKTVDYLCEFKPFLKNELVLYMIINRVPDCYYDLQKEPFSRDVVSGVHAWEAGVKAKARKFMDDAKTRLVTAGFSSRAIHIRILDREKGVARDILSEAEKGYSALVFRRRGRSKLFLPIAMGSVSTKLVEKAANLPIILAGVKPVSHSLFIAVDGSECAARAVRFTARTIAGSGCKVVLCSVIRDSAVLDTALAADQLPEQVKSAVQNVETQIQRSAEIFEKAGIKQTRIIKKIISGAKSRVESIAEAADKENCDTLVLGRKGKSDVSGFDIGRIPLKIIHGAREMTVWVVP